MSDADAIAMRLTLAAGDDDPEALARILNEFACDEGATCAGYVICSLLGPLVRLLEEYEPETWRDDLTRQLAELLDDDNPPEVV